MEEIVLKTYNISKKYGNQVSNDKISITIKKGEIYGLIGKKWSWENHIISYNYRIKS